MSEETKTPNFYERLAAIQSELKAPKEQYNGFSKYSFRNIEDILEKVKPLNEKYGMTLIISDSIENIDGRFYLKATATLLDNTGSGNKVTVTGYAREAEHQRGKDDSQITGSSSSYARKYALGGLYLVDNNKDADSQNNQEQEQVHNNQQNDFQNNVNELMSRITYLAKFKKTTPENIFDWIAQRTGSDQITTENISQWVGYLKQLEAKANG